MNRFGTWIVAIISLAVMVHTHSQVARAAEASEAGAGLHKRLDVQALGETLQRLRMGLLLETLADETGDGQLKIEALLFQADAADSDQRDKLLDQAAQKIKTQYEALGKTIQDTPEDKRKGDAFDESVIAYYKLRLRYAQVQALERGKPYIDRLTFLLGGQQDQQALASLVEQAAELLGKTQSDLKFEISDAREDTDKTKMVYLVPELEDVQSQLEFTAGKLRYYAAMVLPDTIQDDKGETIPNPARETLLMQAVKDLQMFADEADYGVQSFAKLQQGRSNRALGKYDAAREQLSWAASDQAEKDVLIEAMFELVRNDIEQAAAILRDGERQDRLDAGAQAFARAEKDLEMFRQRGPEVQSALGVDVKALVLEYYLYDQWAAAARTADQPKLAAELEKKAQNAFVTFLEKYKEPDIQAAVGRLFRDKFRGRDLDVKNLAPGIVLLLATMEMQDASDLLQGQTLDALDPQSKAQAEELLAKAEEMLKSVRDNTSPEASKTLPDALWKLGVLYVQKNENFQAGEMFRQLVKEFPDHPQARDAALNAVKIANQLVASQIEQGKNVSKQRRLELVESIRVLLKHWPEDEEAAKYHYDLAWQCEKLAETEEGEPRLAWLNEAIQNYQSVHSDSPFYNEGRFYALELLYQLLQEAPADYARNAKAQELAAAMSKFGAEMYPLWQKETNPKTKAALGQYGATSEFHAEVIRHDMLNQQDDALKQIESLSTRWPGTAVLREGSEFAIRSRLARGDVKQALSQFDAFREKYGDEQAQGLMTVVVEKLREAILALSLERGKEDQLKLFRNAYAQFAQQVYQTSIADASATDKYYLTLLYADSLVQTGSPDDAKKALELYEGLQATDAQRREEFNAKITAEFATLNKQAQEAKNNAETLAAMEKKLVEVLQAHELQDWKNSKVEETQYLFERYTQAKDDKEKAELQEMASQSLVAAYEALEEHLLQQAPIDATLLMGLASSHETLKQYPQAVDEYGRLTQGLDPNKNPRAYWEAQLGYCRCFLEAHKSNPEQLKGLQQRVDSLQESVPPRWLGKLNAVKEQADKILRGN